MFQQCAIPSFTSTSSTTYKTTSLAALTPLVVKAISFLQPVKCTFFVLTKAFLKPKHLINHVLNILNVSTYFSETSFLLIGKSCLLFTFIFITWIAIK